MSIDPTTQQELLRRLDVLAAKLGVAVDVLWPEMVRMQYVDGAMGMIVGALCLGSGVYAFRNAEEARPKHGYDDGLEVFVARLVGSSCVIFGAVFVWSALSNLAAPQASAFLELLGKL